MDGRELTPEQKSEILYRGGLSAKVVLAGHEITLGELASRDRYKIFECFERDIAAAQKSYRDYVRSDSPGIFRALMSLVRSVLGIRDPGSSAVSIVRKYVEDLTDSDVDLIQMCAYGRNKIPYLQIRKLVLDAPPSEVQAAVKKALEINGIDVKKFMAAREIAIPPTAASTTTSTAG